MAGAARHTWVFTAPRSKICSCRARPNTSTRTALMSEQPQEEVLLFDVVLGEPFGNARQAVVTNRVCHFDKSAHFFLTGAVLSFGKSVVMQTKQIFTLMFVKKETAEKSRMTGFD